MTANSSATNSRRAGCIVFGRCGKTRLHEELSPRQIGRHWPKCLSSRLLVAPKPGCIRASPEEMDSFAYDFFLPARSSILCL